MSRLYRSACVFLLAVTPVLPATVAADEPVDWEMVNRIRDEGLNRSRVMATTRHLADVIGSRLTGSPGMAAANEWTRDRLTEWGLANAHLEGFDFGRGWSFSHASVHMVEPHQVPLIALPQAWTPGTDGPVRGPVMRVKLDSEEDLEKHRGKLAGKILLVEDPRPLEGDVNVPFQRYDDDDLSAMKSFPIPEDEDRGRFRKRFRKRWAFRQQRTAFLVEEGVLATVSISSRTGGLVRVGGGGSREVDGEVGVPGLVMTVEHYNWLARLLDATSPGDDEPDEDENGDGGGDGDGNEDGEDGDGNEDGDEGGDDEEGGDGEDDEAPAVVLELDVRARFHDDDLQAYNTVAELPGSDPDAGVVMVGAHLDSWHGGTGATDNAAACAVAMEALRILKAVEARPRRTIRIALWSGEEQGLIGSRAYVGRHFGKRPTSDDPEQQKLPEWLREPTGELELEPAHADLSAYFNLDNGGGKIRGIYAQENAAVVPIFAAWLEPFHDLGATTVASRSTGGTDHLAFDRVGLPGFQFIQDVLAYPTRTHHTNMDVLDHVSREDVIQASVVLASFLYHAANRDQHLPRKPLPKNE